MSEEQEKPPAEDAGNAAGAGADPRPTKPLPSRRIGFDTQLDILRAYAAVSPSGAKAVTNAAAGKLAGIAGSTVSINKVFFASAGLLIKSDAGYAPSREVIAFHQASQWNADDAGRKLAPALRGKWFAEALLPHLTMKPMDEPAAIQRLAEACSATPDYENRLQLLLDYLETSGLISRDGGVITLGPEANGGAGRGGPRPVEGRETAPKQERRESPPGATGAPLPTFGAGQGGVQFRIDVSVDMAEMAGWDADRIAAFFAGVAQVLAAKGGKRE